MLECLKDLVGVLKEDTPLITQGLTTEEIVALRVSKSGLFLDELPGGVHMKALPYIDTLKPFAKFCTDALEMAAKTLTDDLVVELNERYKKARKTYMGQVGRMSYAGTLSTSNRYQALQLKPIDYIHGIIEVTRINLIVNNTTDILLQLLQVPAGSVMGTVVKSWNLAVTANQFKTIEIPEAETIKLNMTENGQAMEYWFVYELPAGTFPKDTKVECSTCEKNSSLGEYIHVNGAGFDNLFNLNNRAADNYSRGLIVDVKVSCDTAGIFCKEYNEDDATAVTMAWATYLKAGELLIEAVLKSPDVNRYTTQDNTYLWGKRNHFRAEYEKRIKYLGATIDVGASNCYVCREVSNMPYKGAIFS